MHRYGDSHPFFLSPETPGKALEDVDEIFMTEAPAWKTRVEFIEIVSAEHDYASDKEAAFRHEDVLPEKNEVEVPKVQQEFKVFTEIAHFPKWEAGAIHLVPTTLYGCSKTLKHFTNTYNMEL